MCGFPKTSRCPITSILVIDDDEHTRTLLRQVLGKAGYQVMEARNGKEGLRKFRQSPAALVITDLLMPEMDGLEVTKALHCEWPTVKIIAITGAAGEGNFLDAARLLGAHRTMRKPFTGEALLQVVQEELQEGRV